MFKNTASHLHPLWEEVKEYLKLNVENAKLSAAEKVVTLLSAVALGVIILVLGIFILIFLSISLAQLLCNFMHPAWAYLIVGGVFLLISAVVILLRKTLIIDPVSRFISRIFLS